MAAPLDINFLPRFNRFCTFFAYPLYKSGKVVYNNNIYVKSMNGKKAENAQKESGSCGARAVCAAAMCVRETCG